MSSERKKLHQLFFPIFCEILFTILTGAVDTLMLATEGDQAVGAVGMALDECVRAVFMYLRWRSGHWRKTGLVRANS